MKRKRFSIEQMVGLVKQVELGVPVGDKIRKVGITEQTFFGGRNNITGWNRSKFGS